jgi:phytoene dehydrogenase-like protein
MEVLGRELAISWPVTPEPVAWQYSHGNLRLNLTPSRSEIIARFPRSEPFWKEQSRLARLLWHLSADGLSWPVRGPRDLAALARKAVTVLPGMAQLLKFASKSALEWIASFGLDDDPDFMRFIDAQLLISVQTVSRYANAINAAIALDLPVSGAWRIEGGMGSVARLLAASIEANGGAVLTGKKVVRLDSIRRDALGVETADGDAIAADIVLANIMPETLALLSGASLPPASNPEPPRWSAFMLYLAVDSAVFDKAGADHLQITTFDGELGEGRSIFVSASPKEQHSRAPLGQRAVTISTHTLPDQWFDALQRSREEYLELKGNYTRRVLDLLTEQVPETASAVRSVSAATPVTWERFTGRYRGLVGGYPQTSLFEVRGPSTQFDNLFLVGDSVFPGQSLPGVVTGARRVVELVLNRYGKNGG